MDTNQFSRDRLGNLDFWQPRQGYRFSMDSVFLADFATPVKGMVADLGAGCGVVGILLKVKGLSGPFCAVEIDEDAAACCRENYQAHQMQGRVLSRDLSQPLAELEPGSFALVVSNPPFTPAGGGRVPPHPSRARARHELSLKSNDLWSAAARLLPKGGRLAFCCPPARLDVFFTELTAHRLRPKRLRLVHGREDKNASIALVEAAKDGGAQLTVEPPLIVYAEGQEYGPETKAIYFRLFGSEAWPA